jgi:arginase family enzyme
MNKKNASKIFGYLDPALRSAVTFIGSGDFHHVTALLLGQFRDPLSVIVFDHHPDWDILPPRLGCGSWVTASLGRDNIRKFVLMGVSSEDIGGDSIHSGNLRALMHDRVEIYPYARKPTKVFIRGVPDNISLLEVKRSVFSRTIHWQELKNKNIPDFFLQVIKRLPTKEVYVSIDKDCLKADYSLTNWEEGSFTLEELLMMLAVIKENARIVGVDILGDYSKQDSWGLVRGICARLDHPRNYSAKDKPEDRLIWLNEQTNIKILELLMG